MNPVSLPRETLYCGSESLEQRGLKVGDKVWVGSNYKVSPDSGTIVGLEQKHPYRVQVEFYHDNGLSTNDWVKTSKIAKNLLDRTRFKQKNWEVGDIVHVGANYSERYGTVVDVGFFRTKVRLDHKNRGSTTCWIDDSDLYRYRRGGW